MKPHLSVVIPAYNEATRLKTTLPKIIQFFKTLRHKTEIIIVNDGSTDQTSKVVARIVGRHQHIRQISHLRNLGKGAAVKTGVLNSGGVWVLFMDADLSTPLSELKKFWPYSPQYPIIIGSRKIKGAHIKRHQSRLREGLGKIFTALTNTLATQGISDITCGFKLFNGKLARSLFAQTTLSDWSFDAEVLYLAQKHQVPIKEVPVIWKNDPRTKVNLISDGLNALLGLITIKFNDLSGKY